MAEQQRDYYEVLGIARDSDAKAIKAAFRKLALQYHPDRNKSPDAEGRFKEIAAAYAVLSDPKKRADYDARGFASVAGVTEEDLFSGINFGDIFGDMGFGFDFGGGLFERLFGRGHGRRRPQRGQDVEVNLTIPLQRIDLGGEESIRINRPITCPECHGTGAKAGTSPQKCSECDGSGRKVIAHREKGGLHFQQVSTCPACGGAGVIIDKPCKECEGRGEVERTETLKVNIPAGIEEGTALRIAGHGLPGEHGNAAPGDMFVIVYSEPDPRFERHGPDLWRNETVGLVDAVLGAQLKVPTLQGDIDVTIPPGTQPNSVLRLRGKGLPSFGGDYRGDLNLRIEIHIPEHLSAKEQKLYEQLRDYAVS
jgi:molecular chaperone DnaJ